MLFELEDKVRQIVSQLPDETDLDLITRTRLKDAPHKWVALWRELTTPQRRFLGTAIGIIRANTQEAVSLGDLRNSLRNENFEKKYRGRGKWTYFIKKVFLMVDKPVIGPQIEVLLLAEQLDANELSALEKAILAHARELIQLVKQVRKKR